MDVMAGRAHDGNVRPEPAVRVGWRSRWRRTPTARRSLCRSGDRLLARGRHGCCDRSTLAPDTQAGA
jgi:hypothetical protein